MQFSATDPWDIVEAEDGKGVEGDVFKGGMERRHAVVYRRLLDLARDWRFREYERLNGRLGRGRIGEFKIEDGFGALWARKSLLADDV